MDQARVFLAVPTYDGIHPQAVESTIIQASKQAQVCLKISKPCSLLARNFNNLWCQALNNRKSLGLTHFAMMHPDVVAEENWLDTLLKEQQKVRADVLSTVIPIKLEGEDWTSTGVYDPVSKLVHRLSLKQTAQLPRTFDASVVCKEGQSLVVNTGLWVCDFTQPWVEKVHFAILDDIVQDADGEFKPLNFSEDWNFSLQCVGLGVRVFATRCVKVDHIGLHPWSNYTD